MGPKTETPLDPQAPITLTFEQLQSLLANRVGRSKDEELELIRAQADANAEANKRALRPENTDHPGVSIFSRPGGEKANPKGEFKFNEPPPYVQNSQGDGMAVDKAGRFYVTSQVGVQVFDPTGRPCGVLPKVKGDQPLTTCVLAGPDHSVLYIAHGTTIYRRTLTVQKAK